MFLSVFDIFKIGIGPSSSHTVGPMLAARRFVEEDLRPLGGTARRLTVTLHGSLAFTGKGHGTDRAVALGLAGEAPDTVDPDSIADIVAGLQEAGCLAAAGLAHVAFDLGPDLIFDYGPPLPGHPNGMVFRALDKDGGVLREQTYYSVGGGFVASAAELEKAGGEGTAAAAAGNPGDVTYPFANAAEMLAMGEASGLSVAKMKRANELARAPKLDLDAALDRIWAAMRSCIDRGLAGTGTLPGGLKVKRRAHGIHRQLLAEHGANSLQPHRVMDWLSIYAMAVNEENAAGGRVVTAPTNGAAGVIPAVIRYYEEHCVGADREGVRTFLLVAAAIGGIIKHNASISGAEVGCQGEVGSASAMAAAGLAAALGATNAQVENAAEIALEHHLGMTCDPIGGLVQVPCIERNALGAVKAVSAASLALRGDGSHFVPLDDCIETMRQTGLDMSDKYKETSKGGLAVNVVAC
jgi:L-serine dehydratase